MEEIKEWFKENVPSVFAETPETNSSVHQLTSLESRIPAHLTPEAIDKEISEIIAKETGFQRIVHLFKYE
jgi:hypothetical protein